MGNELDKGSSLVGKELLIVKVLRDKGFLAKNRKTDRGNEFLPFLNPDGIM
jgi:hypothetical protein